MRKVKERTSQMNGKIVLVSGATNGIGKVTAFELAKMGATVVLVGRNPQKTESVRQEMESGLQGSGKLDSIIADLSSLAGMRSAAETFLAKYDHLDVLVNNAGGFFSNRLESADGFEMTFALNHLNYFYLTGLLLDVLKRSAPARIVNVSSVAHYGWHINFNDLQREKTYSGWQVYSESKLMNIYFTRELAKRLQGSSLTVNALHPGFVATDFGNGKGLYASVIALGKRFMAITPQEGARTSIYLASSPEVQGISGKYFSRCHERRPSKAAMQDKPARRLWEISEDLVQKG
jgi:NAD(P)-dependent dehydrogenase (short-subunit alcohol dehydrogenase family)